MNNSKGLTLFEVLASLTLLTVVMSVAFLLFGSVNNMFSQASQDYSDDNKIKTTMNTISNELSDATAFSVFSMQEYRYKTIKGEYRSIVYIPADKKVVIRSSSDATNLSNGTYTDYRVLGDNVEPNITDGRPAFGVYDLTTTPSPNPVSDLTPAGFTASPTDLLQLSVSFASKRIDASGSSHISYSTKDLVFKIVQTIN